MKYLFIIPFLLAFTNVPAFPNIFYISSFVFCTIMGISILLSDRKFEKDRADMWQKAYLDMIKLTYKRKDTFPGEEWKEESGYE